MSTHVKQTHLLHLLCALLCMVSLTSCYTTRNYLQSVEEDYNNTYMYCTKDHIIAEKGKPTRIETADDGTQIVIYEEYVNVDSQDALVDATTDAPAFVQTDGTRKYLEFYIGKDSRCYQVKSNHTQRISKREKAKPSRRGIIWGVCGGAVLLIESVIFMILELG